MWTGVYWSKVYWSGNYWTPTGAIIAAIKRLRHNLVTMPTRLLNR